MNTHWERCPRCRDAKTTVVKGMNQTSKNIGVVMLITSIFVCLLMGLFLPCLWILAPACVVWLVMLVDAKEEDTGKCKVCKFEWTINKDHHDIPTTT